MSELRDPSLEELNSPLFNAIWNAIKGWDLRRTTDSGYAGATGTDVCTILDAIKAVEPVPAQPATPQPLPDCAACVAPDQGVAHVEGTRQHPRAETATPKMQEALDRVASMAHDMIMLLASKTNIVKGDLAATVMKLADIRNEARAALAAPDAPPEKENGQ